MVPLVLIALAQVNPGPPPDAGTFATPFAEGADAGADAGVLAAPPVGVFPEAERHDPEAKQVRVHLRDGQVLNGLLLQRGADGSATLDVGGAQVVLPAELVESVEDDSRSFRTSSGELWFQDPNRTRYLYGPSAMMLRKNEVYFSQAELLASTVSWGVTDFLGVQAGAAVPLWFIPPLPQGFNLLVGAKVGGSITEQFHLATGVQALAVPFANTGGGPGSLPILGIWFGTASVGGRDAHASISLGVPFILGGTAPGLQSPVVTVSGNYRVSRSLALVSENWLITQFQTGRPQSSFVLVNSLAVRAMGEKLAADIGLVLLFNNQGLLVPVPVPWLTFTYNFF